MNPTTPKPDASLPTDTAVESLLAAGRREAIKFQPHPHARGYPYIVLRNNEGSEGVHLLTNDTQRQRPDYMDGTVPLDTVGSFCELFQQLRRSDARIYASLQPLCFVAVLNDHGGNLGGKCLPDWRDHRIVFTPSHSAEWDAWAGRDDRPFSGNIEWAEWLEDQHFDIIEPSGATMLEIALNFRVNDQVSFSNPVRLQDGNTEFHFQHIVDGSAQGKTGTIKIPEQFTICIPVWAGLHQKGYALGARLRYRLHNGGLKIWYTLIRPHKIVELAFEELVQEITDRCDTPVLFGLPEKK